MRDYGIALLYLMAHYSGLTLSLFSCVEGWCIGKGRGLSDLQYAMLVSTGSVSRSATVMTVVHDCQVIDLPEDLFGPHDVPVDCIVTPTRVIWCADRQTLGSRSPPVGVIWSLLGPNDLDRIPVLRRIRYREWKSGKDVHLSGEQIVPTDLSDAVLPEPHVSIHGDHEKIVAEKPAVDRPGARNDDDIVDKTKNGSVEAMADDRKPARYGDL